jgi:hypothetical protein
MVLGSAIAAFHFRVKPRSLRPGKCLHPSMGATLRGTTTIPLKNERVLGVDVPLRGSRHETVQIFKPVSMAKNFPCDVGICGRHRLVVERSKREATESGLVRPICIASGHASGSL